MTTLTVKSPYNENVIKEIHQSTKEESEQALALAYETFQNKSAWLKPYERIAILEKSLELFREERDRLAFEAAQEGGKPLVDSLVEADRAILGVKSAIEHISQMRGTEIPMNISISSANRKAYTYREPVGVVFAISAFNHPLNLAIHQIIPAIAVGCPVVIKPASSTPISCFNVVDLLQRAGLPKEWAQVITCSSSVAEGLVQDERVSFLSFIGSGKVGWHLRSLLPPGAGCALEHGGAAPVIVEPDVEMETALPLLVKGGFYHAGQVCVSVQRIFAHDKICKKLAKAMAKEAKNLIVGDPTDIKTEVGPLISKKEVERIELWVQEAIDKGAKLLCGGKRISDTCYEPTVLLNPPEDANVSNQEIFGPVICVYSYSDMDEAIGRANALGFSFQASVFTKNIDKAYHAVNNLDAVAVMINDHTAFRVDWMPFGGRKKSGLAMGGIPYSMHDMTYEKMMVLKFK